MHLMEHIVDTIPGVDKLRLHAQVGLCLKCAWPLKAHINMFFSILGKRVAATLV